MAALVNVADFEAHARRHVPRMVWDYYSSGKHRERRTEREKDREGGGREREGQREKDRERRTERGAAESSAHGEKHT